METRTIKLIEARFFQLTLQLAAESLLFLMIIASWLNGIKRRSHLMERV